MQPDACKTCHCNCLLHSIHQHDQIQDESLSKVQHRESRALQNMSKAYYQAMICIIAFGTITASSYFGNLFRSRRFVIAKARANDVYILVE